MKYLQLFENFETFDLQKDFDYLNELMFGNRVQPVLLKWFKSKNKLGLLSHIDKQVTKLEISNFYDISRKQYMETLAHEMIHAYMVQNGIFEKDAHGPKFMRILNDLNTRFPEYNIKKTENASEFAVNATKSKKSIGVLLFRDDTGDMAVFVSEDIIDNTELLDSFIESLHAYIKKTPLNVFYKYKYVDLEIYKCDNPELSKFTIKRKLSLNNLAFFTVDSKTLADISTGDLLKTIKLK